MGPGTPQGPAERAPSRVCAPGFHLSQSAADPLEVSGQGRAGPRLPPTRILEVMRPMLCPTFILLLRTFWTFQP